MTTSTLDENIIKQVSTIDLMESVDCTPESMNTSSYGSDPIMNKFGKLQDILNPENFENDYNYLDTIPQASKFNLEKFAKDIGLLKKALDNLKQQIDIKYTQKEIEDSKLARLETKTKRHKKKVDKLDERCKGVQAGIEEYDKISTYFREMFEKFDKNDIKIQEYDKRQSKIEGIVSALSLRKGKPKVTSQSPRSKTECNRLILKPRGGKVSKN